MAAQINSLDPSLHILNLDAFGCSGGLMFHIWGGSTLQIYGRSDADVLADILSVLTGMYQLETMPQPVFTHVTRWSEDPFSLGSYTAGEPGSGDKDRHAYTESLPIGVSSQLLFHVDCSQSVLGTIYDRT